MSFNFLQTEFEGLVVIQPHTFDDSRGQYVKYMYSSTFKERGIPTDFLEFADIYAKKGSVRGLHFQLSNPQGKLVHLLKGKIYDVAVDIRPASKTFGKAFCCLISEADNKYIFIPGGFAHGFLALEDSVFSYQSTGEYDAASSGVILWNDPALGIDWPVEHLELIVSEKDRNGMLFDDFIHRL